MCNHVQNNFPRPRIGPSASQLGDVQQLLLRVQQLESEKAELESQISGSSLGTGRTEAKPELAAPERPVATPVRSKEPEFTTPTRSKEPEATPTRSKEPEVSPTRSKEPEVSPTRSKEPEVTPTRSKEPEVTPTRSKEPVFHSSAGPSAAVLNGVNIKTQAAPVPRPSLAAIGVDSLGGDEIAEDDTRVNSQTHRKEYMKLAAWISLCGCVLGLYVMSICNLRVVDMNLVRWPTTPTCWHCTRALLLPHDCID